LTRLGRRRFLKTAAAASAAALAPGALDVLLAGVAHGATARATGYGPLVPDPAGLLDLPAGFHYRTMSAATVSTLTDPRFADRLDDGVTVPALHDGMASFAGPDGITILIRNHEMEPGMEPAVDPLGRRRYDRLGTGGTTTLWVDAERQLKRSFASLSGTLRNCAGGPTPWGSWLTCEECTYMPGPLDATVHDRRPDVAERHGYVFEVDARAEGLVEPVPIRAMGRFYHEALAVDSRTGFVYLTEDRIDGLIYRYRPEVVTSGAKRAADLAVGDLARGGTLEALRIVTRPAAITRNWADGQPIFPRGKSFDVDWVTIPDTDPEVDMERDAEDTTTDDPLQRPPRTAPGSIRGQGIRLGAAQFARGEGACWHGRSFFVCCTNGGRERAGQVWRLDPDHRRLTLLVEPDDRALLDGPDNVVVAPNGDLVVCEDGRGDQHVVGITRNGRFYMIARNAINRSEFAGACWSPDGRTLFVNVQEPGVTFAVWGPWEARRA